MESLTAAELQEFVVALEELTRHFKSCGEDVRQLADANKIPADGLPVPNVTGAKNAIKKLKSLGRDLTRKIGAAQDDVLEVMEKNRKVMQKVRERKKATTNKKRG